MSITFKAYLLIIGLFSMAMGLWTMAGPNFIPWYPAFGIENNTSLANFIRTMSGVFGIRLYLSKIYFSSSKPAWHSFNLFMCIYVNWKMRIGIWKL